MNEKLKIPDLLIGEPLGENGEATKEEITEFILSCRLGRYYNWEKPKIKKTIGPCNMGYYDACEQKIINVKNEINRIMAEPESDQFWQEVGAKKYLSIDNFPWFADGFGHPDYVADFEYWGKMAHFGISEIACLTIGFDPKNYKKQIFENFMKGRKYKKDVMIFFNRRMEQLYRYFDPNRRGNSVRPKDLLEWILDIEFETHPEFLKVLKRADHSKTEHKGKDESIQQDIDPREKTSLLQIILIMAMDCYKFDPKSKRIDMAKEIEVRGAFNGIKISRETIRNHLKSAGRFYNGEWK